jgi:hypothetical protein
MIARVFITKTSFTPTDDYVYIDCEPPFTLQPDVTEIHISVTFSWDMARAEQLYKAWATLGLPTSIGGPAFEKPSYDFIPGRYVKDGCTITSRGCPNHCWFCAVPRREKGLRELPIQDGWNILDDNLLACSDDHVEKVFQMLERQPHKAKFSGGLEAKLLKAWHCKRLREIKAGMMFFAYDTPDDYEPLVQAGKLLQAEGFDGDQRRKLICYNLIGYCGDTFEKAEKRLTQTWGAGFLPYAMLYRDESGYTDKEWRKFQREWVRPQIIRAKMKGVEV